MMENPRREEEKMIKDIRNLFKREKETNVLKDRVLRDTKHLFEYEEQENYYESVRVSNFGVTVILNMTAIVIEIK